MKTNKGVNLPRHIAEKVASFPEASMGGNKVTLIFNNGDHIGQVFLAWGETIVRIGDRNIKDHEDIDFNVEQIDDVVSEI